MKATESTLRPTAAQSLGKKRETLFRPKPNRWFIPSFIALFALIMDYALDGFEVYILYDKSSGSNCRDPFEGTIDRGECFDCRLQFVAQFRS